MSLLRKNTMGTIRIEYVCTGNNGRSPMAEAIARDYASRQGLESRIRISSSGTNHNHLFVEQRDNPEKLLAIVEFGLKNGIYRGRVKSLAERVADRSRTDKAVVDECVGYLVKAEGIYRDMALLELGLIAKGEHHQPTMPQDVQLILAMAKSNAQQVQQIYAGSGFNPIITTVNEYANLQGEVSNPFCQLFPAYQKTRDDLLISIPRTIDHALEELS